MATDQQKRIKKETKRLKEIYKSLPDNKYAIAIPLIENAAFMRVTLEDLQIEINNAGSVEDYKHGEGQYGKKESSALKAYNNVIKNYNAVNKRLEDMLPAEESAASKLSEFLNE